MKKTVFLSLLAGFITVSSVQAQIAGPLQDRINIFSQNAISNIGAYGDTLWVGPLLSRNIGNSFDWFTPENADSVINGRGRLFSIALAQDTIVAGLGYSASIAGSVVQTAQGFYISVNGGNDWRFVSPPLDDVSETTIRYGGQDINSTAIIVPQQSPPFNVSFKGDAIFTAAWASGIRRSLDFGYNWDRILLPPFELDELDPENTYDFNFDPRSPAAGSPYPQGWQNFLGFSVFIDSDNHVWAGTAGGINISNNAMIAPADSIRWRHIRAEGGLTGMLGNWIIRIRENPFDNKIWMTNWISNSGEQQGIVSTSDKGVTFDQHLMGERINDITFNGSVIYAAGDTGLLISHDNGSSWVRQPQIRSVNSFLKESAQFRTAASGRGNVWIGSSDGLIMTNNDGGSWQITRVDFPLKGGNIFQPDAPNVDVYAYPNPFSITQHELIRIRFEAKTTGTATVELYDYGMNMITTLPTLSISQTGVYEAGWNGLDVFNRKVANGPVFYRILIGDSEITGKFLMLD